MPQSFAVIWELTKRYNTTYRTRKDARYVFPSQDAWKVEAIWFAQVIMREVRSTGNLEGGLITRSGPAMNFLGLLHSTHRVFQEWTASAIMAVAFWDSFPG
jgi:hypothetical protein